MINYLPYKPAANPKLAHFLNTQYSSWLRFLNYELANQCFSWQLAPTRVQCTIYGQHFRLARPNTHIFECILDKRTYSAALYMPIGLHYKQQKRIDWCLLANLPLMTKQGHFVINGLPRVIVSQVNRRPGVYFRKTPTIKNLPAYTADFIAHRGPWLRLEMTEKQRQPYVRIKGVQKFKAAPLLNHYFSFNLLHHFLALPPVDPYIDQNDFHRATSGHINAMELDPVPSSEDVTKGPLFLPLDLTNPFENPYIWKKPTTKDQTKLEQWLPLPPTEQQIRRSERAMRRAGNRTVLRTTAKEKAYRKEPSIPYGKGSILSDLFDQKPKPWVKTIQPIDTTAKNVDSPNAMYTFKHEQLYPWLSDIRNKFLPPLEVKPVTTVWKKTFAPSDTVLSYGQGHASLDTNGLIIHDPLNYLGPPAFEETPPNNGFLGRSLRRPLSEVNITNHTQMSDVPDNPDKKEPSGPQPEPKKPNHFEPEPKKPNHFEPEPKKPNHFEPGSKPEVRPEVEPQPEFDSDGSYDGYDSYDDLWPDDLWPDSDSEFDDDYGDLWPDISEDDFDSYSDDSFSNDEGFDATSSFDSADLEDSFSYIFDQPNLFVVRVTSMPDTLWIFYYPPEPESTDHLPKPGSDSVDQPKNLSEDEWEYIPGQEPESLSEEEPEFLSEDEWGPLYKAVSEFPYEEESESLSEDESMSEDEPMPDDKSKTLSKPSSTPEDDFESERDDLLFQPKAFPENSDENVAPLAFPKNVPQYPADGSLSSIPGSDSKPDFLTNDSDSLSECESDPDVDSKSTPDCKGLNDGTLEASSQWDNPFEPKPKLIYPLAKKLQNLGQKWVPFFALLEMSLPKEHPLDKDLPLLDDPEMWQELSSSDEEKSDDELDSSDLDYSDMESQDDFSDVPWDEDWPETTDINLNSPELWDNQLDFDPLEQQETPKPMEQWTQEDWAKHWKEEKERQERVRLLRLRHRRRDLRKRLKEKEQQFEQWKDNYLQTLENRAQRIVNWKVYKWWSGEMGKTAFQYKLSSNTSPNRQFTVDQHPNVDKQNTEKHVTKNAYFIDPWLKDHWYVMKKRFWQVSNKQPLKDHIPSAHVENKQPPLTIGSLQKPRLLQKQKRWSQIVFTTPLDGVFGGASAFGQETYLGFFQSTHPENYKQWLAWNKGFRQFRCAYGPWKEILSLGQDPAADASKTSSHLTAFAEAPPNGGATPTSPFYGAVSNQAPILMDLSAPSVALNTLPNDGARIAGTVSGRIAGTVSGRIAGTVSGRIAGTVSGRIAGTVASKSFWLNHFSLPETSPNDGFSCQAWLFFQTSVRQVSDGVWTSALTAFALNEQIQTQYGQYGEIGHRAMVSRMKPFFTKKRTRRDASLQTNWQDLLDKFTQDTQDYNTVRRYFSNKRKYSLSLEGRRHINQRLNIDIPLNQTTLTPLDIVLGFVYLIRCFQYHVPLNDIDHLSNRLVKPASHQLLEQCAIGWRRLRGHMQRQLNQRYAHLTHYYDHLTHTPYFDDLLNTFFTTNPLSQMLDHTNALAEITHKRRLSCLGTGGVDRDTATMDIRTIHTSHFGRICPIETPEGKNAGLVNSLTARSRVDHTGQLKAPFYASYKGLVLKDKLHLLTAQQEEDYYVTPGDIDLNGLDLFDSTLPRQRGKLSNAMAARLQKRGKPHIVPVKHEDMFVQVPTGRVDLVTTSPFQMISVATGLIPFLEHNDGNRALMGSNMQRQAVPCIKPQRPIVRTGFEGHVVSYINNATKAMESGLIGSVDSGTIMAYTKGTTKTRLFQPSLRLEPHRTSAVFQKPNMQWYLNASKVPVSGDSVQAETVSGIQSFLLNPLQKQIEKLKLSSKKSHLPWDLKQQFFTSVVLENSRFESPQTITSKRLNDYRPVYYKLLSTCIQITQKKLPKNKYLETLHLFHGFGSVDIASQTWRQPNDLATLTIDQYFALRQRKFMVTTSINEAVKQSQQVKLKVSQLNGPNDLNALDIIHLHHRTWVKPYGIPPHLSHLTPPNGGVSSTATNVSVWDRSWRTFGLHPLRNLSSTYPRLWLNSNDHKQFFNASLNSACTGIKHSLSTWQQYNDRFQDLPRDRAGYSPKEPTVFEETLPNTGIKWAKNHDKIEDPTESQHIQKLAKGRIEKPKNPFFEHSLHNMFERKEAAKDFYGYASAYLTHLPRYSDFHHLISPNGLRREGSLRRESGNKTYHTTTVPWTGKFYPVYQNYSHHGTYMFRFSLVQKPWLTLKRQNEAFQTPWTLTAQPGLWRHFDKNSYQTVLPKPHLTSPNHGARIAGTVSGKIAGTVSGKIAGTVSGRIAGTVSSPPLRWDKNSRDGFPSTGRSVQKLPLKIQRYTYDFYKAHNVIQDPNPRLTTLPLWPDNTGWGLWPNVFGQAKMVRREGSLGYGCPYGFFSCLFKSRRPLLPPLQQSFQGTLWTRKQSVYLKQAQSVLLKSRLKPKYYQLDKIFRTNQNTYTLQRPSVRFGQSICKGNPLTDSASCHMGEFSVGQNLVVGYTPWQGYNFEDAILLSQRMVDEDLLTSIHVERYTVDLKITEFGPEFITNQLSNWKSHPSWQNLEDSGIVKKGTWVKPGDIMVGKCIPTGSLTGDTLNVVREVFNTGLVYVEAKQTPVLVPNHVHGQVLLTHYRTERYGKRARPWFGLNSKSTIVSDRRTLVTKWHAPIAKYVKRIPWLDLHKKFGKMQQQLQFLGNKVKQTPVTKKRLAASLRNTFKLGILSYDQVSEDYVTLFQLGLLSYDQVSYDQVSNDDVIFQSTPRPTFIRFYYPDGHRYRELILSDCIDYEYPDPDFAVLELPGPDDYIKTPKGTVKGKYVILKSDYDEWVKEITNNRYMWQQFMWGNHWRIQAVRPEAIPNIVKWHLGCQMERYVNRHGKHLKPFMHCYGQRNNVSYPWDFYFAKQRIHKFKAIDHFVSAMRRLSKVQQVWAKIQFKTDYHTISAYNRRPHRHIEKLDLYDLDCYQRAAKQYTLQKHGKAAGSIYRHTHPMPTNLGLDDGFEETIAATGFPETPPNGGVGEVGGDNIKQNTLARAVDRLLAVSVPVRDSVLEPATFTSVPTEPTSVIPISSLDPSDKVYAIDKSVPSIYGQKSCTIWPQVYQADQTVPTLKQNSISMESFCTSEKPPGRKPRLYSQNPTPAWPSIMGPNVGHFAWAYKTCTTHAHMALALSTDEAETPPNGGMRRIEESLWSNWNYQHLEQNLLQRIQLYNLTVHKFQYGTLEQWPDLNHLSPWATKSLMQNPNGDSKQPYRLDQNDSFLPIIKNKHLSLPTGNSVINSPVDIIRNTNPERRTGKVQTFIAIKRCIQVGDKLSGRHGNKGIISRILPRQDMPYLPDGTTLDLVLNPLGVPSRMNVGQLFESLLGFAGGYLNQSFRVQAFDEIYGLQASRSLAYTKLYEARLKTGQHWLFNATFPGKVTLYDGRTGERFEQLVTVGRAYILKLIHMVDEKIHARTVGPYAVVTQQPVRGRSRMGGQRLGEMEVWALQGFGGAYMLHELLTYKSDDGYYRQQVADILLNDRSVKAQSGAPGAFGVLMQELRAMGLNLAAKIRVTTLNSNNTLDDNANVTY